MGEVQSKSGRVVRTVNSEVNEREKSKKEKEQGSEGQDGVLQREVVKKRVKGVRVGQREKRTHRHQASR